ncbi:MAG: hypothetical protein KC400_08310, partial [Methanolinea sp.]|nr:hypothetical protein [Methanolinea sp.]
ILPKELLYLSFFGLVSYLSISTEPIFSIFSGRGPKILVMFLTSTTVPGKLSLSMKKFSKKFVGTSLPV